MDPKISSTGTVLEETLDTKENAKNLIENHNVESDATEQP